MTRHIQLQHGIAAISHNASPETLGALDEMLNAAAKQMQIKESPILFSSPMIIAILTCKKCGHISEPFPCEKCGSEEFVKTQTRRVVKGLPDGVKCASAIPESNYQYRFTDFEGTTIDLRCPYGRPPIPLEPADRLWVRETWGAIQRYDALAPSKIPIGSSVGFRATANIATWCQTGCNGAAGKWRPSIFMPRWASRITLEITSIRVERLQDISEQDAVAEGMQASHFAVVGGHSSAKDNFYCGWNMLNAKRGYPWGSNPWVFVLSFRRIKPRIIDTQRSIA